MCLWGRFSHIFGNFTQTLQLAHAKSPNRPLCNHFLLLESHLLNNSPFRPVIFARLEKTANTQKMEAFSKWPKIATKQRL